MIYLIFNFTNREGSQTRRQRIRLAVVRNPERSLEIEKETFPKDQAVVSHRDVQHSSPPRGFLVDSPQFMRPNTVKMI